MTLPETDRPVVPVVIKKYANRRLYDTESSIYITLDSLADMVRQGRDFVVFDAKTGDDITRSVLTQIIVEEETRGRNMLPTAFLRQLIGFYGDTMQGLVPEYLDQMMQQFAVQQAALRTMAQKTVETLLPATEGGDEAQKSAVVGRAMGLLSPFYPAAEDKPAEAKPAPGRPPSGGAGTAGQPSSDKGEIEALRAEVAALRQALAERTAAPERGSGGGS